jgi:hypothetical protein
MITGEDTLRELLERTEKYSPHGENYWEMYKTDHFMKMDPAQRVAELIEWDKLLEFETKPSRDTADLITRRREISDLDNLLRRVGK